MNYPEVTGSSPVGGIFAFFASFLTSASHGRCFSSSGASRRRQEAPGGDDGGVRVLLEAVRRGGGGGTGAVAAAGDRRYAKAAGDPRHLRAKLACLSQQANSKQSWLAGLAEPATAEPVDATFSSLSAQPHM